MSLLKEPVFQFSVIGVVLFAFFALQQGDQDAPPPVNSIVVDEADVASLISEYRAIWRRAPTPKELDHLLEADIREEILVREALALGLDRSDAVIRSRLRQKMQFLTESAAQTIVPSDAELQAYLDANAEQFRKDGQISFDQVFLGHSPSDEVIADALSRLEDGSRLSESGQRTLLPATTPLSNTSQVDRIFGDGFAETVLQGAPGVWKGPVRSGYGVHVTRLREFVPSSPPDLALVREKVEAGWRRDRAKALGEEQYQQLLQRYEVNAPSPAVLDRLLSQ